MMHTDYRKLNLLNQWQQLWGEGYKNKYFGKNVKLIGYFAF